MVSSAIGYDNVFTSFVVILFGHRRYVIVLSTPIDLIFFFYTIAYSIFSTISGIIYDVIVEPPSVGSTTDEHGHSRPVRHLSHICNWKVLTEYIYVFGFFLSGTGRIYAVQSERSIHHGRIGKQFSIHHRWSWFHYHGSGACSRQTQIKSISIDIDGIHIHFGVILHHMDFYAHEIAGLFATINTVTVFSNSLTNSTNYKIN